MSLLHLAEVDGIKIKRVAGTNNGEYAAPCPVCGGVDRFRLWPEEGSGKWWCRQCKRGGDQIQYLIDIRGMNYMDASLLLGIEPQGLGLLQWDKTRSQKWEPRETMEPSDLWESKARTLIGWAKEKLQNDKPVMEWLMGERGLTVGTIEKFNLGLIPSTLYRERTDWGLPENLKDDGSPKKLWIPNGLVIPYGRGEKVSKIKIRRPEPDAEPRYYLLPGSSSKAVILGCNNPYSIIVESELDGILIHQEAGDIVQVVILGSAQAKPDKEAAFILENSKKILISTDCDDAGCKAAWEWWTENFKQTTRWPPVGGKDPGEMFKAGVDIRSWVRAAFPDESIEQKRDRARASLTCAYRDTFEKHGISFLNEALKIDGWQVALKELEEKFRAAWEAGGDCKKEVDAIEQHLRSALNRGTKQAA